MPLLRPMRKPVNRVTKMLVEPTRAEGRGACEPAHHSYVRHIKEHLQQIGQGQRQADQEDLFGQRPFGQRLCG